MRATLGARRFGVGGFGEARGTERHHCANCGSVTSFHQLPSPTTPLTTPLNVTERCTDFHADMLLISQHNYREIPGDRVPEPAVKLLPSDLRVWLRWKKTLLSIVLQGFKTDGLWVIVSAVLESGCSEIQDIEAAAMTK